MTKTEYDALMTRVEEANNLYRAGKDSMMTDAQYDECIRHLRKAEEAHPEWKREGSVTDTVGSDLTPGFKRVNHAVPMLSINDVFEKEYGDYSEVHEWYESVAKTLGRSPSVLIEPKIDGCAATVVYDDGKLKYVATRGDGKVGDNITMHACNIVGIPSTISFREHVEIRGEIVMYKQDFDALNAMQEQDGQKLFANPRNLTAGTIKSLDFSVCKRRKLHFVAHGMVPMEGRNSAHFLRMLCATAGIPCVDSSTRFPDGGTLEKDIDDTLKGIDNNRANYPYDIDGAVIKLDNDADRAELGETSRAPRWACALKYRPQRGVTTIRDITLQIGRTGAITPVAELAPVKLSGSTVSRATLHNQSEIDRLGVRRFAVVEVEKAGEIIPAIVNVVDPGPKPRPYSIMRYTDGKCPVCGTPLEASADVAVIRCPNPYCKGRLKEQLRYMCGRSCLDIVGIGSVAASALVDSGMVSSILDIFTLTQEQLANLNLCDSEEGQSYMFGDKMAAKTMKAIQKARTAPFSKWLAALGIPGVGKTIAETLAVRYADIHELRSAGMGVTEIVGPAVGKNIVSWFFDRGTDEHVLMRMVPLGIEPASENTPLVVKSDVLKGEVVVITGKLSQSRAAFESMVVEHGGKVASSVSGNTTILLIGEKAGSKLAKAEKLGIAIVDEEEFMWMINQKK